MTKKKEKTCWRFKKPVPDFVEWSRLKKARQDRGLTLADLALAAGIASLNTLMLQEKGFTGRPETRAAISAALRMDEADLYPTRVLGDTVKETNEKLNIEVGE